MRPLPALRCEQSLADRLMVGHRTLTPFIGVRVPVRQQSAGRKLELFGAFAVARRTRTRTEASGTLWVDASAGRASELDYEQSEII